MIFTYASFSIIKQNFGKICLFILHSNQLRCVSYAEKYSFLHIQIFKRPYFNVINTLKTYYFIFYNSFSFYNFTIYSNSILQWVKWIKKKLAIVYQRTYYYIKCFYKDKLCWPQAYICKDKSLLIIKIKYNLSLFSILHNCTQTFYL